MFCIYWEQTATCATYSTNWLVFITELKIVYCAVRTGSLNQTDTISYLGDLYCLFSCDTDVVRVRRVDFHVIVVTVQIRFDFWDQIPYNYGKYYNTQKKNKPQKWFLSPINNNISNTILKLTWNLQVSNENFRGINAVRAIFYVVSNINTIYRLQFVHLRYKCSEIMVIINTWSTFYIFKVK